MGPTVDDGLLNRYSSADRTRGHTALSRRSGGTRPRESYRRRRATMRRNTREGHDRRRAGELARRQLLVADRRPAHVARATTRRSSAAELAVLKRHGLTMTRSFFYWPDFMPGPYEIDEKHDRALRRLPRQARRAGPQHRSRPSSSATCPARTGTRPGETAATCTTTSGWSAGRPGSRPRWSAASTRHPAVAGWLVSNEMPIYGGSDDRPRDRRGLGADHQGRGPRGRRPPAVLARRRRLGHRGHRRRQRLPADRHSRDGRLPRPAHLPGRRRPYPAALRGRPRLRAGRHVRQAGDHGGVRRQLGLRLRR